MGTEFQSSISHSVGNRSPDWTALQVYCRYNDSREVNPLTQWRSEFVTPLTEDLPDTDPTLVPTAEPTCMYFGGHSLGLVSRRSESEVKRAMSKWKRLGLSTHFVGSMRGLDCDEETAPLMARVVGAKPSEVALMNALTVNIHILLAAFLRPAGLRRKVLIEHKAFPSDHYAVESQLRFHGLDPGECMVIVKPRDGEACIRTCDIIRSIRDNADTLCLVWLPGIQYLTGQLFDIPAITAASHEHKIVVGWDLAHAVGNVPLALHDWDVDFAAWCTYKYLNSGPGSVGGVFVHEKLSVSPSLQGWWSHRLETRFEMTNEMDLADGVQGFRISNPSLLHSACLKGSLDVFDEAGMSEVRQRSLQLTRFLEALLDYHFATANLFTIVTPRDVEQRGAQLSLRLNAEKVDLLSLYGELTKRGAVVDKRMPDVIRMTPAPLYVSYSDTARLAFCLMAAFESMGLISSSGA